jgi:hypothetical protein
MKIKRHVLAITVATAACVCLVWLCTSIQGGEKTYEVHPYITTPEYRTDAARAIDAYERLMERYMDLTEMNRLDLKTDLKDISAKLLSIETKLTKLSARMTKIEKALGIKRTKKHKKKNSCPMQEKKKSNKKLSPSM